MPNVDKVEYIFLKTGASKAHTGLQKLRADPENRKHGYCIHVPCFLSSDRVYHNKLLIYYKKLFTEAVF
jgi:hypothetical protein